MPWSGSNEEKYWLDWLGDRPWTTLFVDGNHECFPHLAELPVQCWPQLWTSRARDLPR